jgi:hypothetical protein
VTGGDDAPGHQDPTLRRRDLGLSALFFSFVARSRHAPGTPMTLPAVSLGETASILRTVDGLIRQMPEVAHVLLSLPSAVAGAPARDRKILI